MKFLKESYSQPTVGDIIEQLTEVIGILKADYNDYDYVQIERTLTPLQNTGLFLGIHNLGYVDLLSPVKYSIDGKTLEEKIVNWLQTTHYDDPKVDKIKQALSGYDYKQYGMSYLFKTKQVPEETVKEIARIIGFIKDTDMQSDGVA